MHGDAQAIGPPLGLDVHLRMFTGDIERRAPDVHETASRFRSGHHLRAEVSAGQADLRQEHGLSIDLSPDPPYPWAVGSPKPSVTARRVPGNLDGGNPALCAFGLDGRQGRRVVVHGQRRLEIETALANEAMLELPLLLLRSAYPAGSDRRVDADVPFDVEHHATGYRLRLPGAAVGMRQQHPSGLLATGNRDARETGADRAFGVEIEPTLDILGSGEHPRQIVRGRGASPWREAVPNPASGLEEPTDLPVGDSRQILRVGKHAGEHHVVACDPAVGYRHGPAPIDAQLEPTGQIPAPDTDQLRHAGHGHALRYARLDDEPSARGSVGDVTEHLELSRRRAFCRSGVAQQRVDQSSCLRVPEIDRHARSPLGCLPVQFGNRIVLP